VKQYKAKTICEYFFSAFTFEINYHKVLTFASHKANFSTSEFWPICKKSYCTWLFLFSPNMHKK